MPDYSIIQNAYYCFVIDTFDDLVPCKNNSAEIKNSVKDRRQHGVYGFPIESFPWLDTPSLLQ